MASAEPVELSVVIPVYGCAPCLTHLYERIVSVADSITSSWEAILVDDRSPDDAWTTVSRLAERDPRVVGIRLSRNFGQEAAISAGLQRARGRWTVVMDCDLQDPPEVIARLYTKA